MHLRQVGAAGRLASRQQQGKQVVVAQLHQTSECFYILVGQGAFVRIQKTRDQQVIFQQAATAAPTQSGTFFRVCLMHDHMTPRSWKLQPPVSGNRRLMAHCNHHPARSTLNGTPHHQVLDLANRPAGIQALGTDVDAVHDRVAAKQPVRVFEIVESFGGCLVTTVGEETISLQ